MLELQATSEIIDIILLIFKKPRGGSMSRTVVSIMAKGCVVA